MRRSHSNLAILILTYPSANVTFPAVNGYTVEFVDPVNNNVVFASSAMFMIKPAGCKAHPSATLCWLLTSNQLPRPHFEHIEGCSAASAAAISCSGFSTSACPFRCTIPICVPSRCVFSCRFVSLRFTAARRCIVSTYAVGMRECELWLLSNNA